ncbi:MAG: hypothetical protein ACFFDC_11080 [Promethearchaeota archaeon]
MKKETSSTPSSAQSFLMGQSPRSGFFRLELSFHLLALRAVFLLLGPEENPFKRPRMY